MGLGIEKLRSSAIATRALTASFALAWVAGCTGPDGAYLGTLDRSPDDALSRSPYASERPTRSVRTREPARTPTGSFLSPQSVPIPSAPATYFEQTAEGRPLHYWVVGEGAETILFLGAQHGNERASSELVFRFLEGILREPDTIRGRRLVIAPLVNPDGYERNTRENSRGVDLNRNFPAKNWRQAMPSERIHKPGPYPRSEPETRFVLYLMERFRPDRVISVHGAARCVNWDGPAEGLARAMSDVCGLPAKPSIGYPTPGSTGTYLGREGRIPVITLELASNKEPGAPDTKLHQTLLTAVHYPGLPPVASLY